MDSVFILVALVVATALLLLRSAVAAVTVAEYQQGLKYRNGRYVGLLGAGRHWIYRPSTTVELVDTRLSFVPIGGQEVVTSDGISVKLSLAVQMRVVDPVAAMHEVDSYHVATYTFVQVALREAVGALPIDDCSDTARRSARRCCAGASSRHARSASSSSGSTSRT